MTMQNGEEKIVDELAGHLQQYENNLSSSLGACVWTVEKLFQEFQEFKEDMSYSPPVQSNISAIRSKPSSVQDRGYSGYILKATL